MDKREVSLICFGATIGLTLAQFVLAMQNGTWGFLALTALIPLFIWRRHLAQAQD